MKKTPKPIFAIGLPNITEENLDSMHQIQSKLGKSFKDYHVLTYANSGEVFKFDCFYLKDFNQVKYEELKNIIKEQQLINQNKT